MSNPTVHAWFSVGGFTCAPDRAAALLGLEPDQSWRAGEGIGASPTPQPEAGLSIRSALPRDADVEVHAAGLLARLPARLELDRLEGEPWAQLSFAIHVEDETPAIVLPAETIARLAALGASVDVDLYLPDPPGR